MYNDKFNKIVSEILESMELNNVGLYVGQGIEMEELPSVVLEQKWRFVITSQKREDFSGFFVSDERLPKFYTKMEDVQKMSFSSINLPIIQLFGLDSDMNKLDTEIDKMIIDTTASDIMGYIAKKLDTRSKLVVIGYCPINVDELQYRDFVTRWSQIKGARVFIFNDGRVDDFTERMKKFADERNDYWCETSLSGVLCSVDFMYDDYSEARTDSLSKQLFYKGSKATYIENKILLKCQNFAHLLTDEVVNKIRPIGKVEQGRYYEIFLDNSSVEPQWYGYSEELDYHLERPFEKTLLRLVQKLLNGRGLEDKPENKRLPVILEGDPGTSKSITLAAIAYKIFKNRNNPIVFIKNEEISFNNEYGREFELLNSLLSEIENAPGSDERVLIVWDTAAYRNVEDIARNLIRLLDNVGRRFVLLCTAYRGSSKEDVNHNPNSERKTNIKKVWRMDRKDEFIQIKVEEKDDFGNCVYSDGRAFFIESNRDLSEEDKFELDEKNKKYTDLSFSEREMANKENDIFMYYFQLRYELRERLAEGLNIEQRIIGYYVKKQLELMSNYKNKEERTLSPMVKALLEAGIDLSDDISKEIENYELKECNENMKFDLDSFNSSIALFSRYKLNVPYKLAFSMLLRGSASGTDFIYKYPKFFDFVTTSIPWLFYGLDTYDRFIFRFRNSKEAEIFIKRNDIDGEKHIEYLIEMFDLYMSEYPDDDEIKNALINLARMMGPNSEYYSFETDPSEHRMILRNLDSFIFKLSNMRSTIKDDKFDINLAQLEITFTREYYGKLWKKLHDKEGEEDSAKRLRKLKDVLELSQICIERLNKEQFELDPTQKKYIQDQINIFAYEMAYCKIAIEDLVVNERERKNIDTQTPEYFQIYPLLARAVNSNPINGYSYNAMFKLFVHEYTKLSNYEQKLTILSEVRGYAEEAGTLDIINRGMNGRDEVQENILKIEEMAANYAIDIDTIESKDKSKNFVKVFDECLSKNKACAIVFVCQQELNKYGLLHVKKAENDKIKNEELSTEKLKVCKKVFDFLSKEEYKICIEKDVFALYLKLRVAWLLFNKTPLNIGDKEAQLTFINKDGWKIIYDICEMYIHCKAENKKPIVYLIYALSIIQLREDYVTAYNAIISMDKKGTASFASQARMRVPYIICEKPGKPKKYFGTIHNVDNSDTHRVSGDLNVKRIAIKMGKKRGERRFSNNIGKRFLPDNNSPIVDLEVGVGYTGFSAYTEKGRKDRGYI